jgi:hypothetical protein
LPSPIELTFPAEHRFAALARVLAGSVAMTCGLPPDDIGDLRLTVDEVGAALVESAAGVGPVKVAFTAVGGRLLFEASTVTRSEVVDDPVTGRQAMADHVLGMLADEHWAGREDDRLRFVISTRLRAGGVG